MNRRRVKCMLAMVVICLASSVGCTKHRPAIVPKDDRVKVISDTNFACSLLGSKLENGWIDVEYRSLSWQKISQRARMGSESAICEAAHLIRHYQTQTQTCTQRLVKTLEVSCHNKD